MDSQRIREIVKRAAADAIVALKGHFDDQNLSQEDKAMIFDNLEAGVPFHPAELNLTTDEEKSYYDKNYMKTIHIMKSGILDHGQTVDETAKKYHNYQAIERKAAHDMRRFWKENNSKSESLSSLLDTLQFDDNNENDRIYATIFTSLLTQQLTKIMDDNATKAAALDIQNKNTAEYDRRVQMESGDLLKIFKDQYAKVAKERAEKMAMEDAEKAAKADYEAGNEAHKEPQLLDSMSDVYRSAYVGKYSRAYKLAINKLKPHGPEATLDDELEQLRQLQKKNEEKGKKKSKPAKGKSESKKLKVNKFAVKLLNKVGIWGQKQLNDVEDVIKEFGSVRAVHNPYRENYYSKEERERCEKILMAYERLQELLELSPARNRDGSKPYVSIKGMLTIAGLTEEQKKDLEALEGKVTSAYLRTAHSAKDSTELDAIVKEADELFERITKELKEAKDKKAQKPEKNDKDEVMKKEDIKIPSIISKVEMLFKAAKENGVFDMFYKLPGLKLTYDNEMKKEPLMRENYERAMDAAKFMERYYELEKGLVESAIIKKNKANKTNKKNKPNKTNKKNKPNKTKPAQQDASKWEEKYKKTREELGKKSKSLRSAKAAKKREENENIQLKQSIELLTKNVNELSRQMQQRTSEVSILSDELANEKRQKEQYKQMADESNRQLQQMTSEVSILRDELAKEERQKEQYKQMVDEMREAMKRQSVVEISPDEKEVDEFVTYMDNGRLDKKRFFESEASHDVLNDLYMLKAKGNLRPEYAEKLNKAIRQIEEGRSVAKGQQELDIPFQKHL